MSNRFHLLDNFIPFLCLFISILIQFEKDG